jgi:hypothetical protein
MLMIYVARGLQYSRNWRSVECIEAGIKSINLKFLSVDSDQMIL